MFAFAFSVDLFTITDGSLHTVNHEPCLDFLSRPETGAKNSYRGFRCSFGWNANDCSAFPDRAGCPVAATSDAAINPIIANLLFICTSSESYPYPSVRVVTLNST